MVAFLFVFQGQLEKSQKCRAFPDYPIDMEEELDSASK